jgi:transcriptional regulator with GAF, ATPase, and Fis domain
MKIGSEGMAESTPRDERGDRELLERASRQVERAARLLQLRRRRLERVLRRLDRQRLAPLDIGPTTAGD